MSWRNVRLVVGSVSALALSAAYAFGDGIIPPTGDWAVETKPPQYTNFGGVGLIETRTARMAPDATLSTTVAYSPAIQRYSVTFQATPWLEGTFNYKIFGFDVFQGDDLFDRQFDVKLRLYEETKYIPEIAVGLQDFLGTGVFSGEYLVASKAFGDFDLSVGIGWGRLGSRAEAPNPLGVLSPRFETRDTPSGVGGEVNFGRFFQGEDVGFFGGISYDTPIQGLRVMAEYTSDDLSPLFEFDDRIPFNFGASYTPFPGATLTGSILHGSEFNLALSLYADISAASNAEVPADVPPFPVREGRGLDDIDYREGVTPIAPPTATPMARDVDALGEAVLSRLGAQGITLRKLTLGADTVQISIENNRYRSTPKAVGRAARVLSEIAPVDVEQFRIVMVQNNMEVSEFDFDREYLEASSRQRGYTASPPPRLDSFHTTDMAVLEGESRDFRSYPRFNYYIGPDVRLNYFDPDSPIRANLDAVASGTAEVAPGLELSGALRYDVFGDLDSITRQSDSVLPRVRSESGRRAAETTLGVERLAADYFWKPTSTTFAKVSGGILENNFAGVGGEVLWRPPESRFAYGAELYYAKLRDFDTLFTFLDYDVVTGHASVYWDTDFYGLDMAVHAGRYLAGDYGVTFEATRRFANGWEVGAFATLTDVPFDEFGEGSFDKGLTFRIPFDWFIGRESKRTPNITLRPLLRDGGARLNPGNRLFRLTQPDSLGDVKRQWNDFSQ